MPLSLPNFKIHEPKFPEILKAKVFSIIGKIANERQQEAYVIGGFVRDCFLGRKSKDIDVVVTGSGIELAEELGKQLCTKVSVFKNFGTAMLRVEDFEVEIVGARKESYRSSSRKPEVSEGTLVDDQNRRDFTINALAVSLNPHNFGELVDPFNGLQDLKDKVLRTPLDPELTYSDDPLRMMRAVRFATQLGYDIEANSFAAIKKNIHRIDIVSMERISDELNKIILAPMPSYGFKLLLTSGLLDKIFPLMVQLKGVEVREGRAHKDNFYHTLEVLDNLSENTNDLWLRWAAILHDIAKPATKRYDPQLGWTFHGHEDKGARMVPKIFNQLKLPLNEKMKLVQKLVQLHLRPIVLAQSHVTDSAVRRLLFDAGDDIDALMMLCHADVTTKNEYKKDKYRKNFEIVIEKLKEVEEKDKVRNWQPPVTGQDIMEMYDLKPGKEIGLLKTAVREAILEGLIPNDREKALEFIKEEALKLGLTLVNGNK